MPLPKPSFLPGLALILAGFAGADDDLNWVDRESMDAMPLVLQRPIPVWCSGIYYNPRVGVPAERSDTVITADRTSLTRDGLIEMGGDVLIEEPGRRLTTQSALLDQSSGKFQVNNGLRLETDQFTFLADGMSGQTDRREVSLDQVRYSLFGPGARGTADYIDVVDNFVTIEQGSYTTCAPGSNGWQLNGRQIRLDRSQGWGEARDVTLRVKGMPVLWLPWITFPIDDRRKSGLLFPTIATSDNGGLDVTQPIYINLHPQMDATVAPRYIDGRGSGLETEFRYLNRLGLGQVSYGVLFSDRQFDNQNREVASWRHNGSVHRWQLTADVNYVSDDFYFKDLDTGLEVSSQTHLPRLGEARYFGRRWQALARIQSWQTIDPTLPDNLEPYRRLPQLQLSGDPKLYGPLHGLWLSDVTAFDRADNDTSSNPTGARVHLAPGLTVRLKQPWGYLEPRARVYHTRYQLDGADESTDPTLTTWGASLDSGLFLQRDTSLFGRGYTQTLEPRVFINKVAYQYQDDLPNFDAGELTFSYNTLFRENRFIGYDRIGDEEKMSVGVTSRFLRNDDGREQVRLRVGQGYYTGERKVQLRGQQPDDADQTPMVADARWNFGHDWYLYSEGQWDTHANQRQRSSLRLGYTDRERRVLNLGFHDLAEQDIQQSEVAAIWPIHRNWRLIGRWLYDLENQRTLETLAGAEWRNCCWKIRLVSQRELVDDDGNGTLEGDSTVLMQIQMTGLGGFGGRVDSLLERSIPGYRSEYE
ncbi:LPS-assembly protein LptD [Alloalcanivorax gelatiniphagus]|uniref:LPS-assembly protein LptD n=1 Tax=Alloalcanivorax gelatiniphagus TaxID=1194167 RepID=A0ABY2XS84_9GAMM|nr:LPS-assembly protein LptD [Alloalcanivorax gelatiniphagus]TMW15247.1 LPS-assembly protein LptD [Alloalcanivorax gelatiniphagus]|tara:strand:- start:21737 stop:24007 length:2271 start_codon:yes stop_codon:yes gene_type:complete